MAMHAPNMIIHFLGQKGRNGLQTFMYASNLYQLPNLNTMRFLRILESIKLPTLWIYSTKSSNNINKMDKTQDVPMLINKVGAFDTYKGLNARKDDDGADS